MTHHVATMLQVYPKDMGSIDQQKLAECIEACYECAQRCTACADACLAEDMVADLVTCIRKTSTAPTSAPPPATCCPGRPGTTWRRPGPPGGLPRRLQDLR